ncbi:MAG: hypothetical protein IT559_00215 [Alphaproteobacteria bacterium]|nr:hypothetical protein [Alphaproteobacteria bacterium]
MTGRRLCLWVLVFLLAGFGPAGAQDIFLKHNKPTSDKEAETPKAPPKLYVAPKKTKLPAGSISYKEKIYNSHLQQASRSRLETLEDWRKSGLKPQTAAEIKAYASASRAASQNVMYKRREALIPHLDRQRAIAVNAQLAAQQSAALQFQKKSALSSAGTQKTIKASAPVAAGTGAASAARPKKPRLVYVRPENKSKSKKVFNGYGR